MTDAKRGAYWTTKVNALRGPDELWRVIDEGMCRSGDQSFGLATGLSADILADYFDRKVADIRTETNGVSPVEFRDIWLDA
jgi:hypothetical protein